MYEVLIAHLRECAKLDASDNTYTEAADAIDKLSAKATPKMVGFAGWKGCRDTRYKCPYCSKRSGVNVSAHQFFPICAGRKTRCDCDMA